MANEAVSDDFEKLSARIKRTNDTFISILSKDPKLLVINSEDRFKIDSIIAKNSRLLKKLEKKEFEIAVVGLEKAGKSTLANALIQVNVLPAESLRCTFTKTEIRFGEQTHADVLFYTKDEFDSNFTSLLKDLGYVKGDKACSLSEFNLERFKKFWKDVEQNDPKTFKEHNETTVSDIETMAENKMDILPHLGTGIVPFNEDGINTSDFKKFITGFENDEKAKQGVHGGFHYAVKSVTIFSKDLGDMQNAVLFDVPGFNSPTKLHSEQTEETLKSADAIIFVCDVGNTPDLDATQIGMLRKSEVDADGIRLKDKSFVFGNKLDKANTAEDATQNWKKLKSDVIKNEFAKPDRVLFGSAQAFLIEKNLVAKDFSADARKHIIENINTYNKGNNGIQDLRKGLKYYYDNDRLQVMQQRADNNEKEIRELLENILKKCKSMEIADVHDGPLYMKMNKAIKKFCKQVRDIGLDFYKKILEEKPFTKKLKEQINSDANHGSNGNADNKVYFGHVDNEQLKAAERAQNLSDSGDHGDYYVHGVDGVLRLNIRNRIRHEAEELVVDEIQKKSDELHKMIVDKLVEFIEPDDDAMDEAKNAADKFISSFDGGRNFKSEFRAVIDRFSGKLIDGIINRPFGGDSGERLSFIKNNLDEFCMLASYYNFSSDKEEDHYAGPTNSKLFPLIIMHDGIEKNGDLPSLFDKLATLPGVKKFLEQPKCQNDLNAESKKVYATDLTTKLKNYSFEKAKHIVLKKLPKALLEAAINPYSVETTSLSAVLAGLINEANNMYDSLPAYLDELSLAAEPPHNKDEMISILNADIDCLKDIFDKSISRAIDLETSFINFNNRAIDYIHEAADKEDDDRIDAWIDENISKLKRNEFEELDAVRSSVTVRKEIAREIEEALKKAA